MPKMNGLDMSEAIRELNPSIPIIITSAHNDKDFLHKAISLGVSEFVTKPINMKTLIYSIKKNIKPILLQQKLDEEKEKHLKEKITNTKFTTIGQMSAGITHEINTPLTFIKGNFEMLEYLIEDLKDNEAKSEINEHLTRINDGLFRIENIISSMKEMSHQSKLSKQKTNVYSTIVTAVILAYNKTKHISNVYINEELFHLNMGKNKYIYEAIIQIQRVEQVWIIIINNAMDELMKLEIFEDRGLDIDISSTQDNITVIFKDNAGGIETSILDKIFEPFKGTKPSSGMGIGLSIAKKIIDEHKNTTIKAYNNEEHNACFEIVFTNIEDK